MCKTAAHESERRVQQHTIGHFKDKEHNGVKTPTTPLLTITFSVFAEPAYSQQPHHTGSLTSEPLQFVEHAYYTWMSLLLSNQQYKEANAKQLNHYFQFLFNEPFPQLCLVGLDPQTKHLEHIICSGICTDWIPILTQTYNGQD